MNNIWITSDTHYGHQNIVYGLSTWKDEHKERCRRFDTLEEHNDTIVKNINAYVAPDDYLYHLGDWAMGGFQNIYEFRNRIKCKNVILCLGNHDNHIVKNKVLRAEDGYVNAQSLFNSVHMILEKEWSGKKYVLCHYPIHIWHKYDSAFHVYGHTHAEMNYNKNAVCVSMECHPEFRPFSLHEINNIINSRKDEEYISNIHRGVEL